MTREDWDRVIGGVSVVIFILVIGFMLLRLSTGCTPAERVPYIQSVENGAAVAQYDAELERCQTEAEKVPRAQAFAAYIECEKAVSRRLCIESAELRGTWKRCAEVSP